MPRPRNSSLLALFKSNEYNQIVCYQEKCDGKVLYRHSSNLERHLKKIHPFIYSAYIQKKKIFKFPRKLNFEKRLIDLVRVYPMLWDKLNEDHLNEDLTNKAWKEISYNMEVNVATCKMKWHNLLKKFRNELMQAPKPAEETDPSKGNPWKSSWKYYSELLFIRDQIDLTEISVNVQPDHAIECMKADYIKEESSESYLHYNDSLEQRSLNEERQESMMHEDREHRTRQSEELLLDELSGHNYRETSGPPDTTEDSKLQYNDANPNDSGKPSSSKRMPILEESDDSDDDYDYEEPKKFHRKKFKHETNVVIDSDSDKMFLLSLLPFLNKIPDKRKLFVRHRIQGVLLEEQEKS